jgi:hypothetical protein
MMMSVELLQRMNLFLRRADAMRAEYHDAHYAVLGKLPPLEVMDGQRYVRVVSRDSGNSRSVYCFIDKSNGDILKAATWKAPAKHKRSNLNDEDYGLSGVGQYGAKYLR